MPSRFRFPALCALLCAAALPAWADGCKYLNLAELPIRFAGNSLQPGVQGSINQKPALMLLDTGASASLLTPEAVATHQLRQGMTGHRISGVGGDSRVYRSYIDEFAVGPVKARHRWLPVIVDMAGSLGFDAVIGSDFWMQADFELALSDKVVRFFRPYSCDSSAFLGYWDAGANVVPVEFQSNDPRPHVTVRINGKEVGALIDSGAAQSVLFRDAAERVGLNPEELPLPLTGFGQGIGTDRVRTYRAMLTFQLGDETIRHARVNVSTDNLHDRGVDMLLGQDWLRAHRVLFANSQRKLYFTYNGSEPFQQSGEPWYRQEAEAGNADAQVWMGISEDTRRHGAEAQAWFRKAAAQGQPRANEILARMAIARRQYAEAEPYLHVTLAAQPSNGTAALFMFLAQAAQGRQAEADKAVQDYLTHAQDEDYLRPVAKFYLGQADEASALKAAGGDEDRRCAVHHAVARWYTLKQDEGRAKAVEAAGQAACAALRH